MNPYYNPQELELELISFDEPDLSYEYNTLCFWATKDGQIYSASDSGCSCPTPFEEYDVPTTEELLPLLERVGTVEQAESIFESWTDRGYGNKLPNSDKQELVNWVKSILKL